MMLDPTSEVVNFCQELIQIPSVSGQEEAVARRVREEMVLLDFDQTWIDKWGNVIGMIKGNGTKKVLFDAHIDTVGVADPHLWSYNPFGGEIDQGRIYGRGASDMKGSLAAMVYAGKKLIQEKHLLEGDIYISGTVFEETFEGAAFAKVLDQVKPDYVIIGEASGLKLKIGQRGRAEILVTTEGENAHSSNPQNGYNAVYAMLRLITPITKMRLPVHEFLGEAIIELTDIVSSPFPGASVVPNLCRATFDRRLLTGENKDEVLRQIDDLIEMLHQEDPGFKAQAICVHGQGKTYTGEVLEGEKFFPPWLTDKHSEIVQKSVRALENLGIKPQLAKYSFCTNGSCSAGIYHIPTVGFGPSNEDQAHVVDEFVDIEELVKASAGFYYLAKELLK